jgi:hypothetical protein
MGLVAFLAVVGALTIYVFHTLFDAPGWGFIAAFILFILGMNASDRIQTEEPQPVYNPPVNDRARTERMLGLGHPTAAVAITIPLIVGIGLGWLLRGIRDGELSSRSFVTLQNHGLLATPPLKAALETVPSGSALVPLEGGKNAQFRAKMTFQSQSHDYCRQYELANAARERVAGIACRIPSGDWAVALLSLLPPSASGGIVPAGAGPNVTLDAAIGALIDGDPLVGEAEAAVMGSGWRKSPK